MSKLPSGTKIIEFQAEFFCGYDDGTFFIGQYEIPTTNNEEEDEIFLIFDEDDEDENYT